MKIWKAYGSEHSANLVLIGRFKSARDAEEVVELFEKLEVGLDGKIDVGTPPNCYSDELSDLFRSLNCYTLSPFELEQFLYGIHPELDENKITVRTDEFDVSAFSKLMVMRGAKVEIFSIHDYPEEVNVDPSV